MRGSAQWEAKSKELRLLQLRDRDRVAGHIAGQLHVFSSVFGKSCSVLVRDGIYFAVTHKDVLCAAFDARLSALAIRHFFPVCCGGVAGSAVAVADFSRHCRFRGEKPGRAQGGQRKHKKDFFHNEPPID